VGIGGEHAPFEGGDGGREGKRKGEKGKGKERKRRSKARESFRIHLGGAIEKGRTSEKRKTDGR
jgi:hypothetical protein